MWPAVLGLLSLALVVFFFGMISARTRVHIRRARPSTETVATPENREARLGNNRENPDAMAMATGARTNKPNSDSAPYGGS